ncbi:hypothetical protein KFL_000860200, partial [Klebsormidium nitens]
MKKYERGTCIIHGDPLITEDVQHVHELQLQLMQEGLLTDPLNVDEMYILVSAPGCMPCYVGVRGCSSLEGYHRHLNALLGGGNYSPELAGALIALFNYRWNYECAVRSKGAKDWGMFDHWLLEAMQDTCAAMRWPNPCPEWRRAPPTEERFGVHAGTVPIRAGVSQEVAGEEPEFLDEEATFVETMLEEQHLKSAQAAGALHPQQPVAVALLDGSTPLATPAVASLPQHDGQARNPPVSSPGAPNQEPQDVRAAAQQGEEPALSPPPSQDGLPRDVRTAAQPGGQAALSPPPPRTDCPKSRAPR